MTLRDRPDLDHQEQNRLKIAEKAEAAGWAVVSNSPLVLTKGEKQIIITFNSGGMPSGAQWTNGNEFTDMASSGYLDLNILFDHWLTWEDKKEDDGHS